MLIQNIKNAILVFCCCALSNVEAAQSDPVAERKARNAQLERVSPVMAREQAYTLSEQESVNQNLRQVQAMLTTINSTLSDLALLGARSDQAKLLLDADKSTQQILAALLASEAQRVASDAARTPVVSAVHLRGNTEPPLAVAPNQAVTPEPVRAFERVTPVVVRSYDSAVAVGVTRPAKVILRVGQRDPEVFYVGDTVEVNSTEFTIESAVPVRTSSKQHGRPVYAITLRSSAGEIQTVEWE